MGYIWETVKEACIVLCSVVFEALQPVFYFLRAMLGYLDDIILFVLPYGMLYLGAHLYKTRGTFVVGGELFIPMLVFFVVGVVKVLANRANVGKRVPTPRKRFTEVDEDGQVSIANDRIQELILYVADLEDWLTRKGWLE